MNKRHLLALFFLLLPCENLFAQNGEKTSEDKKKPVSWYGSISSSANFYGVTGIAQRSNPFFWHISGNFGLKHENGLNLPISFTIGRQQFAFQRPFLQLGFSPKYKNFTFHVGHRNLTFSQYTLNGHTFLGLGAEFKKGLLRLGAMGGYFNSPFQDVQKAGLGLPTYRRFGVAAKIGVGKEENFVDFVVFKAKDDSTSIARPADSLRVAPGENLALGVASKLTFWKKLTLDTDFGVSIFTRDIAAVPLRKFDYVVMQPTASTRVGYAGRAALTWRGRGYSLRAEYERVMPEYQTMGAYFFANDLERLSFVPFFALFENKVIINGSIGLMRNNLLKTRTETNLRTVGNFNVNILPKPHYGLNFNYTNNANNQQQANVPLPDSVRIRNNMQALTIAPFYSIVKDTAETHTISLAAMYQNLTDLNRFTKSFTEMQAKILNLNYSGSFGGDALTFSGGLNYNDINAAGIQNTLIGATAGAGKMLMKKAVRADFSANGNLSMISGVRDGFLLQSGLNMSTKVKKRHTFSLNVSLIYNQSAAFDDFLEYRGGVTYVLKLK
jgi:hypothetical protein